MLLGLRKICVLEVCDAFGCTGGADPLESERVFSGNVFSGNHLKPKDYPIHGIDVSKFQGDIDWNAVADSGVKFAIRYATSVICVARNCRYSGNLDLTHVRRSSRCRNLLKLVAATPTKLGVYMERAARIHKYGPPEVLTIEPVDAPLPGPGEALIRRTAIGLRFVEVYFRRGTFQVPAFPAVDWDFARKRGLGL